MLLQNQKRHIDFSEMTYKRGNRVLTLTETSHDSHQTASASPSPSMTHAGFVIGVQSVHLSQTGHFTCKWPPDPIAARGNNKTMQHMTECGERRGQVPDRQLIHLGMGRWNARRRDEHVKVKERVRPSYDVIFRCPDPNLTLLTIFFLIPTCALPRRDWLCLPSCFLLI